MFNNYNSYHLAGKLMIWWLKLCWLLLVDVLLNPILIIFDLIALNRNGIRLQIWLYIMMAFGILLWLVGITTLILSVSGAIDISEVALVGIYTPVLVHSLIYNWIIFKSVFPPFTNRVQQVEQ